MILMYLLQDNILYIYIYITEWGNTLVIHVIDLDNLTSSESGHKYCLGLLVPSYKIQLDQLPKPFLVSTSLKSFVSKRVY